MSDERYTLDDAARLLRAAQCAAEGNHEVIWIPTRYETDGPNTPGPLYGCTRCSMRCFVAYPLDTYAAPPDPAPFLTDRRLALRRQCTRPHPYRFSMEGHLLARLNDRQEYVCSRCDALATFQEKW